MSVDQRNLQFSAQLWSLVTLTLNIQIAFVEDVDQAGRQYRCNHKAPASQSSSQVQNLNFDHYKFRALKVVRLLKVAHFTGSPIIFSHISIIHAKNKVNPLIRCHVGKNLEKKNQNIGKKEKPVTVGSNGVRVCQVFVPAIPLCKQKPDILVLKPLHPLQPL